MGTVSLIISIIALAISGLTAWLTLLRRGTLKTTRPAVIFFGQDQPVDGETVGKPKIFLRSLLFSTAKRGAIIESLYVTLSRNESRQSFNIWVYGEQKLVRGSGLFVPEGGFSANHHFLAPNDGHVFVFEPGRYNLSVYANVLGRRDTSLLLTQPLEINSAESEALKSGECGLYFDWSPATGSYISHVDRKPKGKPNEREIADFFRLLGANQPVSSSATNDDTPDT